MERSNVIALVATTNTQILQPNSARKGFKVETLGTSSPVIVVGVRAWSPIPATDVVEVQTITPNLVPASGTFKIKIGDLTTAAIAYNANAAAIQAAIRLLAGYTLITVSGTTATAIVITMTGAPTNSKVSLVESTMKTLGVLDVQTITSNDYPEEGDFTLSLNYQDSVIPTYFRKVDQTFTPDDVENELLEQRLREMLNDPLLTVEGYWDEGIVVTRGVKTAMPTFQAEVNLGNTSEQSETQKITLSAPAAEGSYKLKYGDDETTLLSWDDTQPDVQAALRLLPGLEAITLIANLGLGQYTFFMTGVPFPELLEMTTITLKDESEVAITAETTINSPYAPSVPFTISVEHTTLGIDELDVTASTVVTARGESTLNVMSASQGMILDESNSGMVGALYAKAAVTASIRVTEVF